MSSPKTYGINYIGSKTYIIPYILNMIKTQINTPITRAIDVFSGTTRVAQAFKKQGWHVTTSDLSWATSVYSGTWISNKKTNTHLQKYIDILNNLKGIDGWLTKNYCDAIGEKNGIIRVWQPKNGGRADAIRDQIEVWKTTGVLEKWEVDTLITSLIFALGRVDNTVGIQQAYLKEWCPRSFHDMKLELPEGVVDNQPIGTHFTGDCLTIPYESADIAYLDPPYSTHMYSTYYHIWDSIAAWDKPAVGLKTNRRIDRISAHESYDSKMSSLWNSKRAALNAFENLIDRLPVKYVIVSYNNESIVDIKKLFELFRKKYTNVLVQEIDHKRNIMSQIGNLYPTTQITTENKEYLFLITKG